MECNGCGSQTATQLRTGFFTNEQGERERYEYCNQCSDVSGASLPDVFWDGKPEINLADDPTTGKPRVFASKFEKARYLKERGLMEAGGGYHGCRTSMPPVQEKKTGPTAAEARAKVAQMGKAYKREQVWKIIKEYNHATGR